MRCPLILIIHILETLDSKALGVFWRWGVEGSSHSSYLVHIVFFFHILNFKKFLKVTNMEQYGGETTFFFIARVTAQTQTFWEAVRDYVRSI